MHAKVLPMPLPGFLFEFFIAHLKVWPYSGWWEREGEVPPTSVSPVTSTTVGISPQNFLTFSFNPFFHAGVKFQV